MIAPISVPAILQSAHTLYLTLYIWNRPPSQARAEALLATSLVPHRHAPGVARGIGDPDDRSTWSPGAADPEPGSGFPFPRTKTEFAAAGMPFTERTGCLLETVQLPISPSPMLRSVALLLAGQAAGSPSGMPQPPLAPLSDSEIRVLRYLPTDLSMPEIANELSVSHNTVRTHMRHMYAKLGTHRRSTVGRAG